MDLQIQLQENKTLHGEIIWKIDKIDYRMRQARWVRRLLCIVLHVIQSNTSINTVAGFIYLAMAWEDQPISQCLLLL